MITQLDPPIPVTTKKGKALAVALIDYGIEFELHWVCFNDADGECWTWKNSDIRAQKNETVGRNNVSLGSCISKEVCGYVNPAIYVNP